MVKMKDGFILRKLAGSSVAVPLDGTGNDFHGMVQLNETGAFLWEQLKSDKSREELVEALLEEYDTTRTQAEQDVDRFLDRLRREDFLCE